ncbi:MAG: hypothetical protein PWQ96_1178 [Clostridia bacterium]|nr:hypothetical protein [Clostridiales bacterium]MDK2985536.1 hypothetical protein [Clostridia bacterium]
MPKDCFQYGGQAVIEGVMMRGPKELAVAVRKQAGNIVIDRRPIKSLAEKLPFFKLPFLRGVLALIEALVIGIQALTYSASQAADEEEEELTAKEIFLTITVAFGLAILLFVVIPTGAAHFLEWMTPFWQNIVEGTLRIAIFLGYIVAISRMKDIQRVFQYHGAEHKVIHTYEAGEELTVENSRKYSTLHPRCGTAFLFMVLILTIILFSFLNTPYLWWRILSRVLLMPIIAGIAYELIKISGKYSQKTAISILIKPGLWLQKLTTREPDDKQLEVAIEALRAVLSDYSKHPK